MSDDARSVDRLRADLDAAQVTIANHRSLIRALNAAVDAVNRDRNEQAEACRSFMSAATEFGHVIESLKAERDRLRAVLARFVAFARSVGTTPTNEAVDSMTGLLAAALDALDGSGDMGGRPDAAREHDENRATSGLRSDRSRRHQDEDDDA